MMPIFRNVLRHDSPLVPKHLSDIISMQEVVARQHYLIVSFTRDGWLLDDPVFRDSRL
jgi:hypothetical protein